MQRPQRPGAIRPTAADDFRPLRPATTLDEPTGRDSTGQVVPARRRRRFWPLPTRRQGRLLTPRSRTSSPSSVLASTLASTVATGLTAIGLVTLTACAQTSDAAEPRDSGVAVTASSPAVSPQVSAATSAPSIVDANGVEAAIRRGAILWDIRPGRDYDAGHLPGAVSIGNIHQVLRDPNREDWIATTEVQRILGEAGIDILGRELVVYGTTSDSGAYYVMNGMRHFGAPRVSVYHGGFDDWVAGSRPVSREPTRLPGIALELKPVDGILIDNAAMVARVREGRTQILDARTVGEFSGEDIRAIRGGHIPHAVNIPYESNWIDPLTAIKLSRREAKGRDGMSLKADEQLRALYAGLDPDREVVVYCQSGVRASVTATVLRELGFRDVKVYEPSWLGYAGTLSAPVENEVFLNVGALNSRIGALQGRITELETEVTRLKGEQRAR